MSEPYREILDLQGREPVGAVLRIGSPKSQFSKGPVRAFSFVMPHRDGTGDRPLHPDFAAYNRLKVEHRKVVRGRLIHMDPEDAWMQKHAARVLGPRWAHWPGAPPSGRWACEGDGMNATRLYGVGEDGTEDRRPIPCPGRLCEFSSDPGGKRPPCLCYSKLLFQPMWGDWMPDDGKRPPEILTRFESQSANTAAELKGFFEFIEDQAKSFGLARYSVYWLPFQAAIVEKTKAEGKRRYPVVKFSVLGSVAQAFDLQRQQIEAAGGHVPLLIGSTDETAAAETDSARDLEGPLKVGIPGDQKPQEGAERE